MTNDPRPVKARSRSSLLRRLERESGVPAKYSLPAELVGLGLLVAVVGMYWDVAWHIDFGRDKNLFTLPHSLIVAGICVCVFGGWLSMVISGPRSRGSLRFGKYDLPAGGLLLLLCGGVALMAFPLDDVWHRLFGEDVTLWGPTHILMIAGASLCALGIVVLVAEAKPDSKPGRMRVAGSIRQYLGAGGVLVALSTLQAEFDYGVPQFRLLYQPIMIAVAAGIALVFARSMFGRFGAIGAVLGFYVIRGGLALLVGVGLDHTLPHFPLYMASAVCVELVALIKWRDALRFGAAAGLAVGTVGFAAEWWWSHVWMPHSWTSSMLPEALGLSAVAGVAAGVIGARIAAAIGADRQAPLHHGTKATAIVVACIATLAVVLAIPLPRSGDGGVQATVVPFDRSADSARVRFIFDQPNYAHGAQWFEVFSWQGGSSKRVALRQVDPNTYVTAGRVPYGGNWKTMLRVEHDSKLVAAPVYLPGYEPTGRPPLALERRTVALDRDTSLLMRESKQGVGSLATPAYAVVALIAALWLAAMAFALSRAESGPRDPRGPRASRRSGAPGLQH